MSELAVLKKYCVSLAARRTSSGSAQNAAYSVADYLSQPIAMILAAPVLLHRLGAPQYGIWMITVAVVGSLGMIGSGFGDATVKYVSEFNGSGNKVGMERVIQSTLAINSILASLIGIAVWAGAPFAADKIFKVGPELLFAATWSIRIAAVMLVLRSIESVFIATLRAVEEYGATVRVSVLVRVSTIFLAVVLTVAGRGVLAIVVASVIVAFAGLLFQAFAVRRVVGRFLLLPRMERKSLRLVFGFGCFSWFQALAAVALLYADRLLVGAWLGTAAVAYYSVCVQAAQPIHGLTAAALNFVFPNISARLGKNDLQGARRMFKRALLTNVLLAVVLAMPLAVFSKFILTVWMGAAFASTTWSILTILAVGYFILAFNVTGHYALLALGKVRFVSILNVVAGVVTLGLSVFFMGRMGLLGAALARLAFGPIMLLYYAVLGRVFRDFGEEQTQRQVTLSRCAVELAENEKFL